MTTPYAVSVSSLQDLAALPEWVSQWRQVTQDDFNEFGDVTNDKSWIHSDRERAQREMGGTIAHGYFVLSLIPSLAEGYYHIHDMTRGYNYGCEKVRFARPVYAGMRLRLRQKIRRVDPRGEGWLIAHDSVVECEDLGKPACVAVTLSLIF